MVTCPSCRRFASRVTNCRSRSTAKLHNSPACSSVVSTSDSFAWLGWRWQRAPLGWPPAPSQQLVSRQRWCPQTRRRWKAWLVRRSPAPRPHIMSLAFSPCVARQHWQNAVSLLSGAARIPCPEGRRSTAHACPCLPTSTRTGALSSLVPLAVIGCDLGLQRTTEPVNPRLDLLGRVAILMREHRTQVGQQVEHDPHGPSEGHPLSGEAVMEELGERLEDRLALVEVCRGLVGQALRRERREGWGGPPRPRQAFEVRQHLRYPRLQPAWWLIHLRIDQGDERPTSDEGVGQTERIRRIMVLEHLLQHAICRGFRVIQNCHSAFLGACRAPLLAGGGRGLVRLPVQTCK